MKLRKMYFDFESGSPWDSSCLLLDSPQSEHEEAVYVLTEDELRQIWLDGGFCDAHTSFEDWLKEQEQP